MNKAELEQQVRVSKMLGFGFVLTLAPLPVIGSVIAMILGLRARRIIQQSGGAIGGMWLAWWCIVVGALDTILLPWAIIKIVRLWP